MVAPVADRASQRPNTVTSQGVFRAAVKLSFTWLGVRKTLAPEQRTTAARAFHADREGLGLPYSRVWQAYLDTIREDA